MKTNPANTETPGTFGLKQLAALIGAMLAIGLLTFWILAPNLEARIASGLPEAARLDDKPARLQTIIRDAEKHARETPSLDAVAQLGRLYHANGSRAEAEACWLLMRQEDPAEGRWPHYLAQLHRIVSDQVAVMNYLRETVDRAPDYVAAWLQMAEIDLKNGNFDQAAASYEQRLQHLPTDPYARMGLARIAMQRSEEREARRLLEGITSDTPEFSAAHNLLAQLLTDAGEEDAARRHRWLGHEAGRFDDAPDPWTRELNEHCFDPDLLRVLGMRDYQNGRVEDSFVLFERAVESDPNDPIGHELVGDLLLELEKFEAARESLEQSLVLRAARGEPAPISTYLNLGDLYLKIGEPERSVGELQTGLDQYPRAFELHNSMGVSLQILGRTRQAIDAFRMALELNPHDADTNCNLANVLFDLGEEAAAVDHFKRSLTLQPTYAKSLTFLALYEMRNDRLAEAGEHVRRLFDAFSGVPDVRRITATWHLRMGLVAQSQGDKTNAADHFKTGFEIDPNVAGLAVNLGTHYLESGDVAAARIPLEAFHRQYPENPQSAFVLAQVHARSREFRRARELLMLSAQLAKQQGNSDLAAVCRELLSQIPRR